jgi:uncharacterized membrane protein required for colicin V production
MNQKITTSVISIIAAFVLWRISDVLFEWLNSNIEITIAQMGNEVTGVFMALKAVVGFLAYDLTSFLLFLFFELLVLLGIWTRRTP